jgi:PTS system nitrogen regulatory IIA component
MQLSVRDVARLLQVNEAKVYGWIREGSLPAEEVNGQYRFNRAELLEWATLRKMEVLPALFRDSATNGFSGRLDDALALGGVIHDLAGDDKDTVLRNMVQAMPLPGEMEREMLLEFFLGRESLGSTGIGNGLAIPHPRLPIVLPVEQPSITLCYLAKPIPYAATDGQPVHTLFAMVSPTARIHLHLLARLAMALRNPQFLAVVQRKGKAAEIVAVAAQLEEDLRHEHLSPGKEAHG